MATLGHIFRQKNHVQFALNVPFPGIKGRDPGNTGIFYRGNMTESAAGADSAQWESRINYVITTRLVS
jgi:hypothetical protein